MSGREKIFVRIEPHVRSIAKTRWSKFTIQDEWPEATIVGPFRTVMGAKAVVHNYNIITVAEGEKWARSNRVQMAVSPDWKAY